MAPFRLLNLIKKKIRHLRLVMGSWMTMEGTDLQPGRKRLSDALTGIFIALFIFGILIFLTKADFSKEGWTEAYFVWDKGKDILALFLLLLLKKKFRLYISLILGLATIRFIWDIIAYSLGMDINVQPAITMLWEIVVGIILFLSIKDLLRLWKQN